MSTKRNFHYRALEWGISLSQKESLKAGSPEGAARMLAAIEVERRLHLHDQPNFIPKNWQTKKKARDLHYAFTSLPGSTPNKTLLQATVFLNPASKSVDMGKVTIVRIWHDGGHELEPITPYIANGELVIPAVKVPLEYLVTE